MSRNDRVAEIARSYVENRKFAGIEWLVERGSERLTAGQVGVADLEKGTPMPEKPIYRLYSMTKPVVSALALILIERGKLRLYDMLPMFNSDFAHMRVLHPSGKLEPASRPITVED